ncbi:hypothetical protein HGP28_16740 [Vibrio sp. SM6]|uniref:Uncharacterized protein n=1 Tax=Vibrio agarilyticus TaxID=2726741 RepID=A0A7X8YIL0_9VIBR|nr:hypothetical protein [Vibrio agarilyticus]NLS14512.1 hypothetical protein [Vibrio agarilyticus]
MKIRLLALSATALFSLSSVAADLTFYPTQVNGSIRHMDNTPNRDVTVIIDVHAKYTKENGKNKKFNETLQFSQSQASFADLLTPLQYSREELAQYTTNAKVRATGSNEFVQSFDLPFDIANETYKRAQPASIGHAALFHETVVDAEGRYKNFDVPALYVNINGTYVPAKNAQLHAPSFVKHNGRHMFKVVVTDIVDNVIVGFIEAKQKVTFEKADYFLNDGDRIPVYWTMKAESEPSCNSACQNQTEAHLSVSQAQVIGEGKRRSDIKAKNEHGELMDWFQYSQENGVNLGLGNKPLGLIKDADVDGRYWVYGSAITKDENAANSNKPYYSNEHKNTPAMAVAIDL